MVSAPLPRPEDVRLAVIGLGYVGLPLAVGFGRKIETLGFDINEQRIAELQAHRDHTLEVTTEELQATSKLRFQRRSGRSRHLQCLHRHRADADRRRQAPGSAPARIGQPHGRARDPAAAAW